MSDHVLITGGAGFIGTRLARRFVEAGSTVTVLDALIPQVHGNDPATTSTLLRSLDGVATVIRGTVTSTEDLRSAIAGATVVVHLAAETGTGQSMYEIDRYTETNVGGTAKLLDLLANEPHTVRRILIASSRSIYGEGAYRAPDGTIVYPSHRTDADMAAGDFDVHIPGVGPLSVIPTDENAKLHPSSVYGITKQMQESLILTVAPTIGIQPVSLRYQNVYGPGQSLKNPYTGILSIFSTLVRSGKEINIFEDGLESRDFVYIDDVVEATFRAATHPDAAGGVFNVGSGTATTVLEVVDALFAAFGARVPTRVSGNYRLGDIRHNIADTTRLREVLGYTPAVDFREGVARFVDWVLTEPIEDDSYQRSLDEMASRNLLK
ncbi:MULTISPECIES: NAD-dependent epimerase/dehydratase family protein [unclassified Microbacterium]|uniref:NAD-dependent epimerase/dehydratase family protein n=1 Tax=unclassified Microbacterium TaxID=2609290 RepID=UPI00214D0E61|nr:MULTISPECIES: NAD-dependent epimerase/dehydratase family protein [unclassified Microbacterium]MCR2810246.1 NAD-dependent epimerase/dehydratase family protein [Microbacterium sp. zg.B185]WIM19925.1 NAD-dependent epimerase/dehydratase family protein [Microbacterium sp. zg-B185]